jgi:hypothetical protein
MSGGHGTFAAFLRSTEDALRLTPEAFAQVLHVTPAKLEQWKRGDYQPSPVEHATVIERIEGAVRARDTGGVAAS